MSEIIFDYPAEILKIHKDCISALGSPKIIALYIHKAKKYITIKACQEHIYSHGSQVSINLDELEDEYFLLHPPIFLNALYHLMKWDSDYAYIVSKDLYSNNEMMFFDLAASSAIKGIKLIEKETRVKIGQILSGRRRYLGITQKAIASDVGISFQRYAQFESGERDIRNDLPETVSKILAILNLEPDIFDGEKIYEQ